MKTSSYEQRIIDILRKEKISFEREKSFPDLRGGKYRYDFYIPSLKILIEMNGEYHFKPIHGLHKLHSQQEHDRRKYAYALANDYNLYAIPYWELPKITSAADLFHQDFLVKSKWHDDFLRRSRKK